MWINHNNLDKQLKSFSDEEKLIAVAAVLSEREKIYQKQKQCKHINFVMYGSNFIGQATCKDCGKTDDIYIFINGLIKELGELYNKLSVAGKKK